MKHPRVPSTALLAPALFLALQVFAEQKPTDRSPVTLHDPPLKTPIEMAGTGLAPAATVRVKVSDRGRVASVEVLRIRPSTEYDELLEKVIRETLSEWRYAPELRQGKPVETTLEWTIQFRSRHEEPHRRRETYRYWQSLTRAKDESRDRWKKVLSLPRERRLKLLEREAQRAEKHLDKSHRARRETRHFVVITDWPDPEVGKKVAGNLEATFFTLHQLLEPTIAPQPEPYKIIVYLYSWENSFDGLKRDVWSVDWAVGFYHPAGMIAFHMQMPTSEALMSTLFHEATHAYLDRYVSKPGVVFPRWLGEGFAEYVGNSDIRKGKLIPGRTRKMRIHANPFFVAVRKTGAGLSLREVKKTIRAGKALTLEEMFSAGRETFYGKNYELYYNMSWLLVHFLRHGQPGWAETEFPALVLYIAEGYPAKDAFRTVYGDDPSSFEEQFREYVWKF